MDNFREIFENNLRAINDSKNTNDLIMTWFDQCVEQMLIKKEDEIRDWLISEDFEGLEERL